MAMHTAQGQAAAATSAASVAAVVGWLCHLLNHWLLRLLLCHLALSPLLLLAWRQLHCLWLLLHTVVVPAVL
jgi:hypothetical protein